MGTSNSASVNIQKKHKKKKPNKAKLKDLFKNLKSRYILDIIFDNLSIKKKII